MVKEVTYGTLEQTLLRLGFTKHLVNGYVAFQDKEHQALVTLPKMPEEQIVLARHLVSARSEVVGMGVADETVFEEALAASSATAP